MNMLELPEEARQAEALLRQRTIGLLYDLHGAEIVSSTRKDVLAVLAGKDMPHVDIPMNCQSPLTNDEVLRSLEKCDLICKIVHGVPNRTGLVQGVLETLRKQYTGTSLNVDLLSREKILMKALMQSHGVPTPRFLKIEGSTEEAVLDAFIQSCTSGKFVLKPIRTNSSAGMMFCDDGRELKQKLRVLPVEFGNYFIEEFISGRVMTVGVVPRRYELFVTPPMEYLLSEGQLIMDYVWKLQPRREAPAKIHADESELMQKHARVLHRVLGAEGVTRTDFILAEDGGVFALEINANVGMSRSHDVPTAFAPTGHDYEELIMIHLATALNKEHLPPASL